MPVFDWSELAGPLGGIIAFALMSGIALGWKFRVAQDKNNREYIENMLLLTNKKLQESDEICQARVDQVREDMSSMEDRHRLEVETLKSIMNMLSARIDALLKNRDENHGS